MKTYTLHHTLSKSLQLLEHRRMMIPRYIDRDDKFLGTNHYTLEMIPPLDKQIEEMKAAIQGIDAWRKVRRKRKGDG